MDWTQYTYRNQFTTVKYYNGTILDGYNNENVFQK